MCLLDDYYSQISKSSLVIFSIPLLAGIETERWAGRSVRRFPPPRSKRQDEAGYSGQGQPFTKVVQAQFSLQTFQRLPIGTEVLEPAAITGGRATIQLTSTTDPNIVSVRLLSLALEGTHFSFRPQIQAITGTLDLRTGAFHISLSFARLMTPETSRPFEWEGTAFGMYNFDSGTVSLTEISQGAFLAQ